MPIASLGKIDYRSSSLPSQHIQGTAAETRACKPTAWSQEVGKKPRKRVGWGRRWGGSFFFFFKESAFQKQPNHKTICVFDSRAWTERLGRKKKVTVERGLKEPLKC